jgi:hypothetical protein
VSKTISWVIIISLSAVLTSLTSCQPSIISDSNNFLKNFVNHELISFLGVLSTITIASAANLNIEFSKIEKRVGKKFLGGAKRGVQKSAYSLIACLGLSFGISIIKPILPPSDTWQAISNSAAIIVITFSILILIDITATAFAVGSADDN